MSYWVEGGHCQHLLLHNNYVLHWKYPHCTNNLPLSICILNKHLTNHILFIIFLKTILSWYYIKSLFLYLCLLPVHRHIYICKTIKNEYNIYIYSIMGWHDEILWDSMLTYYGIAHWHKQLFYQNLLCLILMLYTSFPPLNCMWV